jgi:putative glutamine amidotransferase
MTREPRPRLGITTYRREQDGQRERFRIPSAYVNALRVVGGLPLLLPPGEDQPEELLDSIQGLVLCGGGDMHPTLFGGAPHPEQFSVCLERDVFDLALTRAALARRMPLLAICRGMQVLNVALGGDLHVHLPDAVGGQVLHRISEDEPATHTVRIAPDSNLGRIYGAAELTVTSWHHQGIARLGRGLHPVAWAEDGTVEALELPGRPEVLAVQWHPEMELDGPSREQRLFAEFAERARSPVPRRP